MTKREQTSAESAESFFRLIRSAISEQRLEAYRLAEEDEDADLLERYIWNIALSEALYPVLQSLEVALRNALHRSFSDALGSENWFDILPLENRERALVEDAKRTLIAKRKHLESGRIVAELTFGFWTSLFNDRYEHVLWRSNSQIKDAGKLIRGSFPCMESKMRSRAKIGARMNTVRQRLRNRIFHHEPIWNVQQLNTLHVQLLEAIGWISPQKRALVMLIDRFPEVYAQGSCIYRRRLEEFLKSGTL